MVNYEYCIVKSASFFFSFLVFLFNSISFLCLMFLMLFMRCRHTLKCGRVSPNITEAIVPCANSNSHKGYNTTEDSVVNSFVLLQ